MAPQIIRRLTVAGFGLLAGLMVAAPASAQFTIQGQVTNSSTSAGVPGVIVEVFGSGGNFITSTTTQGGGTPGNYTTNSVSAGSYYIRTQNSQGLIDKIAVGSGGRVDCVGCSITGTGALQSVNANQTGVNFTLSPGVRISGSVSGGGSPKTAATVGIFTSTGSQVAGSTQTLVDGTYITGPGLLPNTPYFLRASNVTGFVNGVYNTAGTVNCLNCSVNGVGTAVSVASGTQSGINIALNPGFTIAGKITGVSTSTTGIGGAQVTFYNSGGSNVGGTQSSSTAGATLGNYTSPTLPPGSYFVATTSNSATFVNMVYNPAKNGGGAAFAGSSAPSAFITANGGLVDISTTPQTDINLALITGGNITGTVKDTAATPSAVPNASVIFYDNAGIQIGSTGVNATTGNYSSNALPTGSYFVATSNSSGFVNQLHFVPTPKAFNGGAQTSFILTGTAVSVTPPNATPVNFSLAKGTTISGFVKNGSDGIQGINVQLLNNQNVFVTSRTTDATGAFSFTSLVNGTYFVKTQNSGNVGLGFIDKAYTPGGGVTCNSSCNATLVGTGIIATGENFPDAIIGLVVGGKITGKVTQDGTNANLQGIQVQAYDASSQFGQSLGSATTAADGTYTITGLNNLTYSVKTTNALGYLDKLYNNIPCTNCNVTAGQGVPVTVGNPTAGINFSLLLGGTIKGKVTNASNNNAGVGNMNVQFYNSAGAFVTSANTSNQQATLGEYTSPGLPAGSYFAATSGFNTGLINQLYSGISCLGCTNSVNGVSGALNGTSIPVAIGNPTTGINFALTSGLSIEGQVTNRDGGEGIPNVRVQVHTTASGTSSLVSATTNASGNYSITGLPPGTYFVKTSFFSSGSTPFQFINQVYKSTGAVNCGSSCKPSEIGTGVTITSGSGSSTWGPVPQASATDINLSLPAGGSITGAVTITPGGAAASGVTVGAYDANNNGAFVTSVSTGTNGTYTLTGLPTSQYYVKASPTGASGLIGQVANGKTCLNCNVNTGDKITVTAGGTATAINFALSSGGTITGTVITSPGNAPLSGISVTLATATNSFVTSTSTNSSGVFNFAGLPADTYYLRTSNSQGYLDKLYNNLPCVNCSSASASGTPIPLAVGETKTANFALTLGSKVSGAVTDAGTGEPVPGITVNIYNTAGSFLTSGTANDAGVYTTQAGLAPGTYFAKTSVGTSSGLYINKLYNNIVCVSCSASSGTGIVVTAGQNTANVNFVLSAGARVTGTITDASNNPVPGVSVSLYSSQVDPQTKAVTFLGSGFTGANGAYAVTGLPAGSAVARTSNSLGYIDEIYSDLKCLGCSVTTGQPFTLTVGTTTAGIDFKLDSGARITGTVLSSPAGTAIQGASINVYNQANTQVTSTSTNQNGVYITTGLPPGTYYVKASSSQGFVPEVFDAKNCQPCQPNNGTAIVLTTNTATANFSLSAGASISGTVTEAAATTGAEANAPGGALADVSINIYDSGNLFITSTRTLADGTFRIGGLAPGTFFARTSNSLGFVDKMFNNIDCISCSLTGGTGIQVSGVAITPNINFALNKGGTISGTVTDTTAEAVSGVTVQLYGASGQSLRSTTTDGLGKYTFSGVPHGAFYLRTRNSLGYIDEVYNDLACANCNIVTGTAVRLDSATPSAVAINFALAEGGVISGTVTGPGGAPIENVTVLVYTSSGGSSVASGYTSASGVYRTSALPAGTYFTRTSNSKGFIDQLYDGTPCSNCNPTVGTPVVVTLAQTTSGINFSLSTGGRISGAVTSGGAGMPGVSVNVYSATGKFVASGFTDLTGSYITSTGLPTGTYYARTSNSAGLVDKIYDNITCPACAVTTGSPISVTTGQTTTGVSFALVSGSRISGTMTDKASGLPIANARVDIYASNGYYVTFASTSSTGAYVTSGGLDAGTYYARAVGGQGYIAKLFSDLDCPACAPFKGTPIVVLANQAKEGIDFALTLGGLLSGAITDAATGAPIGTTDTSFVNVQIYNSNNQIVAGAQVDAAGRYTSGSGLPSGTYFVRTFNNQGYINKLYNLSTPCLGGSGSGNAGSSGGSGLAAPSCVPNSGTPVLITAGQTTGNINFSLAAGLRLGGTVIEGATGLPIAGAGVVIFDSTGKVATSATTDNAGKYLTTGGLPPGTYYAVASAYDQGYSSKIYNDTLCLACSPTSGAPIVLSATRTDVNFSLALGGSISGSVKATSTNAPIANLKLSLYSSAGSWIASGRTDANGKFLAIGVPPGSYFVRTFNLSGFVDESYSNKTCAPCPITAATPIVVAARATTSGIDFSLANGGLVHGYITDATSGNPLQGATVAFYLADNTTFVGRTDPTDENGYYAISLPVGTYIPRPDPVQGYTPVATTSPIANGVNGQISTVGVTEGGDSEVAMTMSACSAPTVSPSTLSNISIGVPFSITLTATGGSGPYTFSVSEGTLPPGLTLNASTGVISGTPTARGTANFTIGASGSNNCAGTAAYAQVTFGVTLSESAVSIASQAATRSVMIAAEASTVQWTAVSDSSWLTPGAASGTGSATLSYAAAANTGQGRTGTITVAGETLTVTQARSNRPRISLDAPANGQALSRSFVVAGWAVDLDASDVGIDALHVYAYPIVNGAFGAPIFLGQPASGPRADVAAAFGPQFVNSGYSLPVSTLADGSYRIIVFARTSLTGTFDAQQSADVTVTPPTAIPAMSLDAPATTSSVGQSFFVSGWAVDRGAASGTGVDAVHVYAFPVVSGAFGAATFLGEATLGGARGDVGAVFGAAFTNSGFGLQTGQLATGQYRVVVYARSTVTGTFNQSAFADVTVSLPVSNPAMSVDGPANGSTQTQPFLIGGWAVDRGAPSGTGVDTVHVWAFNVGTGAAQFVTVASYGGTRGDVAAVFGPQFAGSGFNIHVSGLAAGTYDIGVYMHSTVSGTFNFVKFVRVTVQ